MFGLGKNTKTQIDDFKATSRRCAELKEEIVALLNKSKDLSNEEIAKVRNTLAVYEEMKNELLTIKNNSALKPKEKLNIISNKKDNIIKIKTDLENTKQTLANKQ